MRISNRTTSDSSNREDTPESVSKTSSMQFSRLMETKGVNPDRRQQSEEYKNEDPVPEKDRDTLIKIVRNMLNNHHRISQQAEARGQTISLMPDAKMSLPSLTPTFTQKSASFRDLLETKNGLPTTAGKPSLMEGRQSEQTIPNQDFVRDKHTETSTRNSPTTESKEGPKQKLSENEKNISNSGKGLTPSSSNKQQELPTEKPLSSYTSGNSYGNGNGNGNGNGQHLTPSARHEEPASKRQTPNVDSSRHDNIQKPAESNNLPPATNQPKSGSSSVKQESSQKQEGTQKHEGSQIQERSLKQDAFQNHKESQNQAQTPVITDNRNSSEPNQVKAHQLPAESPFQQVKQEVSQSKPDTQPSLPETNQKRPDLPQNSPDSAKQTSDKIADQPPQPTSKLNDAKPDVRPQQPGQAQPKPEDTAASPKLNQNQHDTDTPPLETSNMKTSSPKSDSPNRKQEGTSASGQPHTKTPGQQSETPAPRPNAENNSGKSLEPGNKEAHQNNESSKPEIDSSKPDNSHSNLQSHPAMPDAESKIPRQTEEKQGSASTKPETDKQPADTPSSSPKSERLRPQDQTRTPETMRAGENTHKPASQREESDRITTSRQDNSVGENGLSLQSIAGKKHSGSIDQSPSTQGSSNERKGNIETAAESGKNSSQSVPPLSGTDKKAGKPHIASEAFHEIAKKPASGSDKAHQAKALQVQQVGQDAKTAPTRTTDSASNVYSAEVQTSRQAQMNTKASVNIEARANIKAQMKPSDTATAKPQEGTAVHKKDSIGTKAEPVRSDSTVGSQQGQRPSDLRKVQAKASTSSGDRDNDHHNNGHHKTDRRSYSEPEKQKLSESDKRDSAVESFQVQPAQTQSRDTAVTNNNSVESNKLSTQEKVAEMQKVVDQIVSRILITKPGAGQPEELRLMLSNGPLKGTEISIMRQHGDIHLNFNTPGPETQALLTSLKGEMSTYLRSKLPNERFEVRIQEGKKSTLSRKGPVRRANKGQGGS